MAVAELRMISIAPLIDKLEIPGRNGDNTPGEW
jgi:hypothetical protein